MKNRKLVISAIALSATLIAAIALAAFQPWKLWVDQNIDEAAPIAATPSSTAVAAPAAPKELFTTAKWQSVSHGTTTGKVKLYKKPDGSYVLRLENLDTSNGPDLKVVLSKGEYTSQADLSPGYLSLGTLKGNKGSSNYTIKSDVDLSQYKSAVIWCKRFDAVFAAAPIA